MQTSSATHTLKDYLFCNYSFVLVYLSYAAYFFKNSPKTIAIVISNTGLIIFAAVCIAQILINYILKKYKHSFIYFCYFYLLFVFFTFFHLTSALSYITEQINLLASFYIRGLYVAFLFILFLAVLSYYANKNALKSIKRTNVFIAVFIISNLFFGTVAYFRLKNHNVTKKSYANNLSKIFIPVKKETEKAKRIIFILLDEYSSPSQLIRLKKYTTQNSTSLKQHLLKKNFTIITSNPTNQTATINAMNELFNIGSGLNFNDKAVEKVYVELKNSSIVRKLANKGYKFKNFSFFNIGQHKEIFNKYPIAKNDFEYLLKYSFFFILSNNLKIKRLLDFNNNIASNSEYNTKIAQLSLAHLNSEPINQKELVYIHFLMPHAPLYMEKQFPYRKVNLENYIAYWEFCNRKIITYLNSIHNLSSYKIIISGDHGFRGDKRINPYKTMSAFYNFDQKEINQIKCVQDIGYLLSAQ